MSDVADDAGGCDQDCGAGLITHGSVIGFPVVVLAAGCGEDAPEKEPDAIGVEFEGVVTRSDEFGFASDANPVPAPSDRGGDGRSAPNMAEPGRTAERYEGDAVRR